EALPPRFDNIPNKPNIKGGDTVIIAAGHYRIGWTKGLQPRWGDPCDGRYASGCVPQAIPSGSAAHPTRILGAGWDKGCKAPPDLYGVDGANQILNLDGASHVVIACLDLTDHSSCIADFGPDPAFKCKKEPERYGDNDPQLGDWAQKGIHAMDSRNVLLQDLNIHGFADMGVQAGRIADWTVTRVKVVGNGNAGWNGDLGGNDHSSSNSGKLVFTDLVVAWNGCAEDYPKPGKFINCYGQEEGGYGDGFGEAWTGGHFVFIRPVIDHNTQDGLDLLYANGTGSVVIDHGYFFANAGNDVKTTGNATITNNVIVAWCSWFKEHGYPAGADSCRAGGGEYARMNGPDQKVTFAFNTMISNADGMFGGDPDQAVASDTYEIANNIFIGTPSYPPKNDRALTFFTWFGEHGSFPGEVRYINNLVWNTRKTNCFARGIACKDPLLKNMSLQNFDPTPLPGSPALDSSQSLLAGGKGTDASHRNIGAFQGQALSRESAH
ncbi:MAG: hypothetical protein JSS21_00140, partial [Proteobacteria bacterium]|nr:hypothetical protein [Pseudomonadota bacterium]